MKGDTTPTAVTFGKGWIAVVSGNDQILLLDVGSGELRQTMPIE
ncbi:DUF6476 family protein [Parasedimentitalea huanghaiensis]